MKIEEVITQTIIAIYSTPSPSKTLFLKGGSAMRLFDNLTSRLSIDADFSVHTDIDNESKFFRDLKSSVLHYSQTKQPVRKRLNFYSILGNCYQ